MKTIYFLGAGSHAKSVSDILRHDQPTTKIIMVDDQKQGPGIIRQDEMPQKVVGGIFISIGDNKIRKRLFDRFNGDSLINIISSLSYVSDQAVVGKGVFIGNFCHIGPGANVGDNTIVNNGAIVEHDVKVGMHCHVAPNAVLAGNSKVGDNVFVGTGATVINNVSVCSDVVIGAGSTVIKDITEAGTYVGCPAHRIAK